ncbi:MAG: hypothetical protein A2289_04955 [Deltaproteobacteria bacterium RIFOXYA12_FULL_58_15]|nr:MAG: hypothetical protein A2289_04955 [Deltaproteobacteria bacterium RIFOXYA12_FULL_58_15]OGR12804.1 MAG: hypothetical protein A2341_24605 [Deltaproteobacteria bacterium RIFOXYB12_FULL_58_9]
MKCRLACTIMVLSACNATPSDNRTGHGDTPGDTSPNVTWNEACSAFAEVFCGRLVECNYFTFVLMYDEAAFCRDRTQKSCLADYDATNVGMSANEFVDCVEGWRNADCGAIVNSIPPPACMVPGTAENGDSCLSDAQCKSLYCGQTSSGEPWSFCGVCTNALELGDECHYLTTPCKHGLTCPVSYYPTQCQEAGYMGRAGDACEQDGCLPHLYCNEVTHLCEAAAALGESCESRECDYREGLVCLEDVSTCALRDFKQPGESCEAAGAMCVGSSFCIATNQGTFCQYPTGDGEPCGTWNEKCVWPALCPDLFAGSPWEESNCVVPSASYCVP